MSSFQMETKNNPPTQLPTPPAIQLLLFFFLLGWLALVPVIVGVIIAFLPVIGSELVNHLLAVLILTILLLPPTLGFMGLIWQRQWQTMQPFGLALLATVLYTCLAAGIRAVSEPGSGQEIFLYLIGLTSLALLIGGGSLLRLGATGSRLADALGLARPPLPGLLLPLVLVPFVIIGWPLTGALGDSWTSQLLLLQTLAITLAEEIFFRGALIGIFSFKFQQRKILAVFMALLTYLAFTPSLLVPRQDWAMLFAPLTALALALLLTELRLFTGSVWAGVLFAWGYRAAPSLFTDPRVELPLITEPWQTLAYLWRFASTAGLALLVGLGWRFVKPRWPLARPATGGLIVILACLSWGISSGLWAGLGYPGFYNDGFLIIMAEQADLSGAEAIDDPIARRAFVRDRLIETALRTQSPVRAALDAAGLEYRPFYLMNMIRVEGSHRRMAEFATLPGVARVMLNPNVRPYPAHVSFGYGGTSEEGQGVGWNIGQVQADAVWEMGFTGQGIVVAGQDTGYDWEHPALRQAYRGNANGQVTHVYNWYDAWSDAPVPFDDDQHGTHTMGTIVGDDGAGNQIGMAPGARWIGCRNMQRGIGNPASYIVCMEFFLAPYPPGGDPFKDGDVSQAPHVINNSWGCPDIEGCDDTVLEPATAALRAAGIMMVVSAGNEGPGCQTVYEPPARYANVFSVGATDSDGQVTGFSSRGPVPGVSSLLKPDVTAPGSSVRSSLPGGGYGAADGTSMAGPHVAGLVALLWSANPALIGHIDETEEIIRQSARKVEVSAACTIGSEPTDTPTLLEEVEALEAPSNCACGEIVGAPNNVYGWGEIDALAAVKLALAYRR
jgi:membrane protease YdiL (CAAX protease family)